MDLGAYVQIDELDQIAKDNGIEVPRLRGYRLMKDEKPISKEKIEEWKKECEVDVAQHLVTADPFWCTNPDGWTYSDYTDRLLNYYLIKTKSEEYNYYNYTGVRWDRIHGKKRKVLKYEIKKQKKKIQKQYDLWNKYAGKENVLYIHARMGSSNWLFNGADCKKYIDDQPWFLDKVDDHWDRTYCDIYAKIK